MLTVLNSISLGQHHLATRASSPCIIARTQRFAQQDPGTEMRPIVCDERQRPQTPRHCATRQRPRCSPQKAAAKLEIARSHRICPFHPGAPLSLLPQDTLHVVSVGYYQVLMASSRSNLGHSADVLRRFGMLQKGRQRTGKRTYVPLT